MYYVMVLNYTSMCLCPCISFARTLFSNALECLVFSRSMLQDAKGLCPSHHDILRGTVFSGNSAFQNDSETIHQTILMFPFCEDIHPPCRIAMTGAPGLVLGAAGGSGAAGAGWGWCWCCCWWW